jgi:hypothetical protein
MSKPKKLCAPRKSPRIDNKGTYGGRKLVPLSPLVAAERLKALEKLYNSCPTEWCTDEEYDLQKKLILEAKSLWLQNNQ